MRAVPFGSIRFRLSDKASKSKDGIADVSFAKLLAIKYSNNARSSQLKASDRCSNMSADTLGNVVNNTNNVDTPDALNNDELKTTTAPLIRNRYDNIIEQLEKKYSNPIKINSLASMDSDQITDDDDQDFEDLETDNNIDIHMNKPKRKRHDVYDNEDSFIDDSEICEEVESAYRSKNTKTKHSGFFVNSGELEITTINTNNNSTGETSCIDGGTGQNGVKYPKLMRKSEIVEAFSSFIAQIQSSAIKFTKQRFPSQLNLALVQLDNIATTSNVHLTTEYYLWIHDCIGNTLPLSKLKSHLSLLRKRYKAAEMNIKLNNLITQFGIVMQSKVVRSTAAENKDSMLNNDDDTTQPNIPVQANTQSDESINVDKIESVRLRWDKNSRGDLLQIEVAALAWVGSENDFRKSLTPAAQKELDITENSILKERDELTNVFKRVSALFPENCFGADVSYLRRMISAEKQRIKSKLADESVPSRVSIASKNISTNEKNEESDSTKKKPEVRGGNSLPQSDEATTIEPSVQSSPIKSSRLNERSVSPSVSDAASGNSPGVGTFLHAQSIVTYYERPVFKEEDFLLKE